MILPPGVWVLLVGLHGQRPAFVLIGLFVGVSVACAILLSGTRHLNESQKVVEP